MFTALREHAEFFVLFQRETLTVSVVSNQPGVCRAVGSFFMVGRGGGGGGGRLSKNVTMVGQRREILKKSLAKMP